MDLEKLSTEELKAIADGRAMVAAPEQPDADLESLSTQELKDIAEGRAIPAGMKPPEKGIAGRAYDAVKSFGDAVDSYTGAPTRAAVSALQTGQNPVAAFSNQFGADPAKAPKGAQIAAAAGVSNEPLFPYQKPVNEVGLSGYVAQRFKDPLSYIPGINILPDVAKDKIRDLGLTKQDAAGLAVDVAADWSNVIPVGAAAKVLGSGSKAAVKGGASLAGRAAVKVADAGLEAAKASNNKAIKIAANTVDATATALKNILNPKRADDYTDMVSVATRNGIDPKLLSESVEFGPNSIITRAARTRAEGVLGQPHLDKFQKGLSQVQQATDRTIAKVGGGAPLSSVDAGNLLRAGYQESQKRFFDGIDLTYRKVMEYAPGLRLDREAMASLGSKVNGVEKFAKGLVRRGATKTQIEQGRQLLRAVQGIRAGNGSYKQVLESMQMIGDVAFQRRANSLADIPADIDKFRDLYFEMSDGLLKTVERHVSPEFAAEILANNAAQSKFFKTQEKLKGIIGSTNLAPESVFKSLILNGDSEKIAAVKSLYSPQELQALKGAFLDNLIARNADGSFNFRTLSRAMDNKAELMAQLFEPSELKEIGEIVRLGDRFGNPIMSTSGTGASNVLRDLTGGLKEGAANDSVIEALKDRARNPRLPGGPGAQGAAPKSGGTVVNIRRPGITLPERGPIEKIAKGAQTAAVQDERARKAIAEEKKNAVQRRLSRLVR